MKIVWSPNSLRQLEKIGDYPGTAGRFIDKIISSVERLKNLPLSGSNVPESPNLKQVIAQGYRVIYRPTDKSIDIIAVLTPTQL